MINIVLMVHNAFTEHLLHGVLSRIPNVNVVTIPSATHKEAIELQISTIQKNILQAHLTNDEINFFIVESNYGKPADEGINASLLEYIIKHFPNAKAVGYSQTIPSLAKALTSYPEDDIWVMDKSNDLTATIRGIFQILGVHQDTSITSRIYTLSTFKQFLQTLDPEKKVGRERSGSDSPAPSPKIATLAHARRNTLCTMTPLYSLSTSNPSAPAPAQEPASFLSTALSSAGLAFEDDDGLQPMELVKTSQFKFHKPN